MYKVSLLESSIVLDVFDTDVFIPDGVQLYPITDEEFAQIRDSGDHGLWKLVDGKIVSHTPEYVEPVVVGARQF